MLRLAALQSSPPLRRTESLEAAVLAKGAGPPRSMARSRRSSTMATERSFTAIKPIGAAKPLEAELGTICGSSPPS